MLRWFFDSIIDKEKLVIEFLKKESFQQIAYEALISFTFISYVKI
jgi:hypothetical protein